MPMHFTFVITRSDEIGGAHIHVRDMACQLMSRGHKVNVVIGGHGLFAQELKECNIRVIHLKYLFRQIRPIYDILSLYN